VVKTVAVLYSILIPMGFASILIIIWLFR
jgi:hypothetical protein